MSTIETIVGAIPRKNQRHMLTKYENLANTFCGVNLDRADIILQGQAIIIRTRDFAIGTRNEVIFEMNYLKNEHDTNSDFQESKRYFIDELVYNRFLDKETYKQVTRKEFLQAIRKREKEVGYKITYSQWER